MRSNECTRRRGTTQGVVFKNACRFAAFRLRNEKYLGVNVTPLREQIRDAVEFVRIVWEEIQRQMEDHDKVQPR